MELVHRVALLAAVLVTLTFSAVPALAGTADPEATVATPPNPVRRINVVRDITFPVVGPARYEPSFGDCRDGCGREHHGVDIFSNGWKGVPVVAAHSGIVERAEVYGRLGTCAIHIRAFDGWETRYVHLNTDTPGTDDGEFVEGCAAPAVTVGAYVEAGQIIGWLGDSGNAEYNSVHLHFEIRSPRGTPVDPFRSLNRAEVVAYTTLDPMGPAEAAIALSTVAYPVGSTVAFVANVDEDAADGVGLAWTTRLTGPILLASGGALDAGTRAELARLAPDVIIVLEREGEPSLAADLAPLARAVERIPFPEDATRVAAPIAERIEGALPVTDPGFRVVVVEDGSELSPTAVHALSDLGADVATVRMVQGGTPAEERGLSVMSGPERPGKLRAVYYQEGSAWRDFPASTPAPYVADGSIVLVAGGDEVTASTFTFLRSMAAVPAMPYWR